jgi:ribonuclease HI
VNGFAKRIGMGSVYLAELRGVYEGLQYAWRLSFRAVEVNGDSKL